MILRFALAALLLAGPASAREVSCAEATNQADMNDCAAESWGDADARLNEVYKEALALLASWDADLPQAERGGAEKLREAQRAWIPFRDAACAVEGWPMRGGSAEPLLVYGCLAKLTEQRISDLEGLLEYQNY